MYWDTHTQTYMTPHRRLNPRLGRWTQPDPLWGIGNMIHGTSPTLRNDRYIPSIAAILQAGNLFIYCAHNPVRWIDSSGLEKKCMKKEAHNCWGGGGGAGGASGANVTIGGGPGGGGGGGTAPKAPTHVQTHQAPNADIAGSSGATTQPWGSTNNLITSATALVTSTVTAIGRAFQKHNSRPGTVFTGEASGNAALNTQQGMTYINKILSDPNTTFVIFNHPVEGSVLKVRMPDGTGAWWSADGTRFIGFLEP